MAWPEISAAQAVAAAMLRNDARISNSSQSRVQVVYAHKSSAGASPWHRGDPRVRSMVPIRCNDLRCVKQIMDFANFLDNSTEQDSAVLGAQGTSSTAARRKREWLND